MDTLNSIVNEELQIPDYISNDAKDFIRRLLFQDPGKRMDLEFALDHPFITKHNNSN